jgi:predicted Zn-dependent protease
MAGSDELYDEAIDLQREGKAEEAIGRLGALLEQEPDYALAHAALSVFYSKLEKHDEAVEHGRRVCELEADDPFSFVAMSLICQKAGQMAEAEHALVQASMAEMAARREEEV